MQAEPVQSEDRQHRVQSVARAISILLAVGRSPSGLKSSEISVVTKLPKQATYHLVHTLLTTGMLTRNERGLYVLGLHVGTLSEGFRRQLAPPEHLAPLIRQISGDTGETAYASGWWNGEIVTLTTSAGIRAVQATQVAHGTYTDSHARASGKLLLAFASEETRSRYLSSHELSRRTRKTITVLPKLYEEFDKIRAQGYAIDDEEFADGLCCIAVPVDQGSLPYALTLSAPVDRFKQNFDQYLQTMLRIAGNFSSARSSYTRQQPAPAASPDSRSARVETEEKTKSSVSRPSRSGRSAVGR